MDLLYCWTTVLFFAAYVIMFISEDNENELKICFAKVFGGKLLARDNSCFPSALRVSFLNDFLGKLCNLHLGSRLTGGIEKLNVYGENDSVSNCVSCHESWNINKCLKITFFERVGVRFSESFKQVLQLFQNAA